MSAEQLTIVLVAFLAGMGIGSGLIAWKLSIRKQQTAILPGSGIMLSEPKKSFWSDWFHGVSTEMAGAIVTAVLFSIILGGAEQQRVVDERKSQLILQMGSPDNAIAFEAVRQLIALGWLYDGTLQGAKLQNADLRGANLRQANLRNADLRLADLHGAHLDSADLQDVNFAGADLRGVNFSGANLRNARLWSEGGSPPYSSLSSLGALYVPDPTFDEETVPPDATYAVPSLDPVFNIYWTPETDMTRFTNSSHPDFWEPEWVKNQREQENSK